MLPAWVIHHFYSRPFQFMMRSKFHFSQQKTYFPQFIDKFLKFEVIEYLIHCVCNRSSLILFKLLALFSTVKYKLGSWFSQFVCRFKMGFLRVSLRLYFQVFPNSQRDFRIFECCFGWTSQLREKRWKTVFFNISLGCTSKLFQIC